MIVAIPSCSWRSPLRKKVAALLVFFLSPTLASSQIPGQNSLIERVGDTGFIRVEAGSFGSLTPKQQQLAYWLAEASIAIDPIAYGQFSRFGLPPKRPPQGSPPPLSADSVGSVCQGKNLALHH